jgi:hypothetical protein
MAATLLSGAQLPAALELFDGEFPAGRILVVFRVLGKGGAIPGVWVEVEMDRA